ncbi:hypothetical protein ACI77O_12390 [Pseudomonas tritici]|uniref:hypothetical protein n=1 Tax=Pseudomonas tritici TaxID=2745518 RepID=UPI00387ACFA8
MPDDTPCPAETAKPWAPLSKRLLTAHRTNQGLHLTTGEVRLLSLALITGREPEPPTEPAHLGEVTDAGTSHEERFTALCSRIDTANRAEHGLDCSAAEIMLLTMTSIIDWKVEPEQNDE